MGERAAKARKDKTKGRKRKPTKAQQEPKEPEPIEHVIPEVALYHLNKLQIKLKITEKVFKEMQEMYTEELQSFINTLNLPPNPKLDVDLVRGSILEFPPKVEEKEEKEESVDE